jgi:hypothetical protein
MGREVAKCLRRIFVQQCKAFGFSGLMVEPNSGGQASDGEKSLTKSVLHHYETYLKHRGLDDAQNHWLASGRLFPYGVCDFEREKP